MAGEVDSLLKMLYEMIEDAKSLPLGADRCILERDRALDLVEEIRAQLPVELAEAQKLISTKTEYLTGVKREADQIKRQAEEQARQIVSSDATLLAVRQKSMEIVRSAEDRSRELRQAANDFCEDALRRTEEAVSAAYEEIKRSHMKFRSVVGGSSAAPSGSGGVAYDVSKDM
jgi:Skp family chaperone for outer membrane proteins